MFPFSRKQQTADERFGRWLLDHKTEFLPIVIDAGSMAYFLFLEYGGLTGGAETLNEKINRLGKVKEMKASIAAWKTARDEFCRHDDALESIFAARNRDAHQAKNSAIEANLLQCEIDFVVAAIHNLRQGSFDVIHNARLFASRRADLNPINFPGRHPIWNDFRRADKAMNDLKMYPPFKASSPYRRLWNGMDRLDAQKNNG
jgi:hypothetical protein